MAITDQMALDAYTGGGGFATGAYLVQHTREQDEDYARRRELATYRNYLAKVCGAYVGSLYAQPAQRSGEAPAWQAFQANADGVGGGIDDLMRRALLLSLLLGTVYILVDRPPGESRSRADDLSRQPYAVIRKPAEVAALTLDRRGALIRVVFAESGGAEYGVMTGITPQVEYHGWDSQGWWVSGDVAGNDILVDPDTGQPRQGTHGLGLVPVVRLHSTELIEMTDERAAPWARSLVGACLDLYNRHSEARAIERDQTVSTLALPVTDTAEADKLRADGLTVGTNNAVLYNPAGGGRPSYFAPPAEPLKLLYQAIAETVQQIYQLANLEFTGGVQQSGVALAFHFQSANRTLSDFASALELCEYQLGRIACAWMGQGAGDLRVVYPKTFDVQDLSARIQEDLDALSLELGPTADRLIRGRASRRVLGDYAAAAEYEQIDRDLATAGDPYGDRIAREAQGGPPGEEEGGAAQSPSMGSA